MVTVGLHAHKSIDHGFLFRRLDDHEHHSLILVIAVSAHTYSVIAFSARNSQSEISSDRFLERDILSAREISIQLTLHFRIYSWSTVQ
jgi:hypothetical protein